MTASVRTNLLFTKNTPACRSRTMPALPRKPWPLLRRTTTRVCAGAKQNVCRWYGDLPISGTVSAGAGARRRRAPGGWALTIGVIVALLAFDLLLATVRPHTVGYREAAAWSAFYIAVAVVFGLVLASLAGWGYGAQYFAGYLVEKSLSVDSRSRSIWGGTRVAAVRSGERDLVVPLRGRADQAYLRALRHGYRRPGHDRVRWEVRRAAVLVASLGLRLRSARPG